MSAAGTHKRCRCCENDVPVGDMAVRYGKPQNICRRCDRQRQREYIKRAPEDVIQRRRERKKQQKKKSSREALRRRARRYRAKPNGKAVNLRAVSKYARKYKAVAVAGRAVQYALKKGYLQKGKCEVCGSENVQAHHDDYLRKLDVRWLCAVHHKEWHTKNGPGLNREAAPTRPRCPSVAFLNSTPSSEEKAS